MNNEKPCCKNCNNKKIVNFTVNTPVYCEVKERRVSPDGLCQWYDNNKKKRS